MIPILLLAREHFGNKGLWLTTLLIWGTYTFRQQINQDLHGDIVMAALISWIVYGLIQSRYRLVLFLSFLMPFTKESAGVTMIMIAFFLIIFRRKWFEGIAVGVVGVASMYFLIHWFIPHYNGGTYRHMAWFRQFGSTFGEQVHTILFHPGNTLAYIFSARRLSYLAALLVPLLGLPLFSHYSLIGLGILAQNLLAYNDITIDIGGHYSAGLIPVFAMSSILVFSRIKRIFTARNYRRFVRSFAVVSILFLIVNCLLYVFMEARLFWISPHDKACHEALRLIPHDKSVSASEMLFSHLHYRNQIYFFPKIENAEYVIVEGRENTIPDNVDQAAYIKELWSEKQYGPVLHYLIFAKYGSGEESVNQTIESLKHDRHYSLIFNKQDALVFHRN